VLLIADPGGDHGPMLSRRPEELPGGRRATQVEVSGMLPGEADAAVDLDRPLGGGPESIRTAGLGETDAHLGVRGLLVDRQAAYIAKDFAASTVT